MVTRLAVVALFVSLLALPRIAIAGKPEVVQVSPNTYMIFKEDHKGIFGSLSTLKMGIIKQANEFAARQGKVLIPVSCRERPNRPGQWASFEYQFRLVASEDPEAKGASMGICPEVVVQSNQSISAQVTSGGESKVTEAEPEQTPKKAIDIYAELIKLDDLRKRGILTEEEFQAEKRKLLDGPRPCQTPEPQ